MQVGPSGYLTRGICLLAGVAHGAALAQQPADSSAAPMVISTAFIDWNTCARPTYPDESLSALEQGTTVLRYVVRTDQTLTEPVVERSSGHERLDRAALDAFSKCKGVPALLNGVPVTSFTRINFNWRIPEKSLPVQALDAKCRPSYPEKALQEGRQGRTKMRFTLSERGHATRVEVLESSGSEDLDAAAMSALVACRFRSATTSAATSAATAFVVEYVWKIE